MMGFPLSQILLGDSFSILPVGSLEGSLKRTLLYSTSGAPVCLPNHAIVLGHPKPS